MPKNEAQRPLRSLEMFAGAGGLALGLHQAGFEPAALLDFNQGAVDTLRFNAGTAVGLNPEYPIDVTDVSQVDFYPFGEINLISGGPPCQPFSLGGAHRGDLDPRNGFPHVFRAQQTLMPCGMLMENVRGLTRKSFRPYFEYLHLQMALPGLPRREGELWQDHAERLKDALARGDIGGVLGYRVYSRLLNSADYGVPQHRERVFIISLRCDLAGQWEWPAPTHSKEALSVAKANGTYWAEHGLPPRPDAEAHSTGRPAAATLRWRTVRDVLATVPDARDPNAIQHHPDHQFADGAKIYPGHTGSPLDEPAKTLKAGVNGIPGGENMVRYEDGSVRYFTVHEAALIQGFPKEYRFASSRTECMRQIGNAAPPPVARVIGEGLRKIIAGARREHPWDPSVEILM